MGPRKPRIRTKAGAGAKGSTPKGKAAPRMHKDSALHLQKPHMADVIMSIAKERKRKL